MERTSKQVIIMRTDLNMRKGKMVAQGAHASTRALLQIMSGSEHLPVELKLVVFQDTALENWLGGLYTKVCLGIPTENDMMLLYDRAKEAGLPCALITDAGLTEFNGVATNTCIAIGPAWSDEIDLITGHLKLL